MPQGNPDDFSPAMFRPMSPIDAANLEGVPDEVKRTWQQFQDGRAYDKNIKKNWPRWHSLYEARHWDGSQRPWMSTPVINLTFSVIQTIVPILTDSRPQIAVVPRVPETDKVAEVLSTIVEWLWESCDMDIKLPKVMTNAMIFGNAFVKVLWDPSLRGGLGDIRIEEVDPSLVFVSPHARTLEDADWVIHAENVRRSVVERLYPGLTGDLPKLPKDASLTLNRESGGNAGPASGDPKYLQFTDGSGATPILKSAGSSGGDSQDPLVTVLEKWERTPEGMTQTVVVNDQLVVQRPSPLLHDRFPFVHFVDHPHTWSFWAMGEVQQVERLQMEINRRRGHIADILRYTASPILVVDPAMIPEWEQVEPRPGLVIPAEGGPSSAQWLQTPSVPAALFEVNALDKADFDVVLGNIDVMSGRRPAGIEAGVAIEMLQEAANVRMRLKVRNLENSIRKLGEVLVSMVQHFYTTERVFKIVGKDLMEAEKPITGDPQAGFMFINKPSGVDPATGQPTYSNVIPPVAEAEFDVRIGAGSTLPVSRATQFQKAITMAQMGIADDEFVWRYSGFPRWKDEMMRSRAYIQQKQMEAMSQQQMAAGPQPGEQQGGEASDDEMNQALASQAGAEDQQPE